MESQTRIDNRKKLTKYWERKSVKLGRLETIDDYIVVPGDETDWVFYGFAQRLKMVFKNLKNIF